MTVQSEQMLPDGYQALEPFLADWALDSSDARARQRTRQGPDKCRRFFEAAKDLVGPALADLDRKPLSDLDESEQRLMKLMLSFAHVSLASEIQRDDELKHSAHRDRLTITRTPADV